MQRLNLVNRRNIRHNANEFHVPVEYRDLALVGQGAYGAVCKATRTTPEGEEETVAIKMIPFFNEHTGMAVRVLRELEILHHFQSVDQVVECHDAFICAPPRGAPRMAEHQEDVYVVMEYVESDLAAILGGNLIDSEDQVRSLVCQLLLALAPMHSRNCTHRDLSSKNVLVGPNLELRICDFGFARSYDPEEQMSYGVVTQWYRAPEVLCDAKYTTKIDIWAVGVLMAEMLTREPFFPGRNGDSYDQLRRILDKVGAPNLDWFAPGGGTLSSSSTAGKNLVDQYIAHAPARPSWMPAEADSGAFANNARISNAGKDFLRKLLRFNPDTRMSAAEALAHPWIQNCQDMAVRVARGLEDQQNIAHFNETEPEEAQRVDQNVPAATDGPELDALNAAIREVVRKIHEGEEEEAPGGADPAPEAE